MMPFSHVIFCHLLLFLPSIFPRIMDFFSESAVCIRWSKYWSFSFSISPSNEYSGLISFRMDWLDVLALQGTLKEFSPTPQFKSINSSALSLLYGLILIFIHDYWKNHSFDYMDFVGKLMSLLFNTLPSFHRFSSKEQVSLNVMAAVTICRYFGAQEYKSLSLFPFVPHLFAMKWWDKIPWSSFFEYWIISQLFNSPLSPSSRGSLVPLHFLPLEWCHLNIWGYLYFSQ